MAKIDKKRVTRESLISPMEGDSLVRIRQLQAMVPTVDELTL